MSEGERASYMAKRFQDLGFETEVSDINNVYARKGSGKKLVVAAHLDTVFDLKTEINPVTKGDKIFAPGIIDNSLGLAGLLYLAREIKVKGGQLLLVATVGEEGVGNLIGAKEVFKKEEVAEFIALEGTGLDFVSRSGPGSFRVKITITGPGGHSWIDQENNSAVEELIKFLNQFKKPRQRDVVINIGLINGGIRISEIADLAEATVEIRSIKKIDQAISDFKKLQSSYKPARGIQINFQEIGRRPGGISEKTDLYNQLVEIRSAVGLDNNERAVSSDANAAFSSGVPAITFGLTTGASLHSLDEYANLKPIQTGLDVLKELVKKRLAALS